MDSEKNRSTAEAIHLIRRAIDYGEQTTLKAIFVLLDWGKAFDKVDREGMFVALEGWM